LNAAGAIIDIRTPMIPMTHSNSMSVTPKACPELCQDPPRLFREIRGCTFIGAELD
jgi:hypothetical protein